MGILPLRSKLGTTTTLVVRDFLDSVFCFWGGAGRDEKWMPLSMLQNATPFSRKVNCT